MNEDHRKWGEEGRIWGRHIRKTGVKGAGEGVAELPKRSGKLWLTSGIRPEPGRTQHRPRPAPARHFAPTLAGLCGVGKVSEAADARETPRRRRAQREGRGTHTPEAA